MGDRLVFVDVETTGLHSSDRIVSIAAISVSEAALRTGKFGIEFVHLIVDPGKKSHPKAEEVHGYDDWLLRHQVPFTEIVPALRPLFDEADVLVAHNAAFDGRFILSEFELAGSALSGAAFHCTMEEYRRWHAGRAGLDAILRRIGMGRASSHHSALEDAWLTMQVYCWMRKYPLVVIPPEMLAAPSNQIEAPPHPGHPLPRRSRKRVAPQPPERKWSTRQTQALTLLSEPIATLMAAIAMADGNLDAAEAAVIADYIAEERERAALPVDPVGEMDIAAGFCERTVTRQTLQLCAQAVMESVEKRECLVRWLRRIAYADGHMSAPEKNVLSLITSAFAEAKASPRLGIIRQIQRRYRLGG